MQCVKLMLHHNVVYVVSSLAQFHHCYRKMETNLRSGNLYYQYFGEHCLQASLSQNLATSEI